MREVLRQAWGASSLVEGLNSVLRIHQTRHRPLTQGLLDLRRLYWNCRRLRRKGQTPDGRLGIRLPVSGWWELLKLRRGSRTQRWAWRREVGSRLGRVRHFAN
ncbi:MAG TPA: hypothetical protein VG013_06165 [Gemmataceae bacterium]|nr:hypothetical protein [Gemmataceae bacterium]